MGKCLTFAFSTHSKYCSAQCKLIHRLVQCRSGNWHQFRADDEVLRDLCAKQLSLISRQWFETVMIYCYRCFMSKIK